VDSQFDNPNIDVTKIEEKITKKTKAIMAVHLYGRLCDMEAIREIADRHDLKVIEDACEAQGAVYKSLADITCYSFYRNKIIAAEEGGMCTTDNEQYAEDMNYFKGMAFTPKHDDEQWHVGDNYRMPNAMAKMALKSLKKAKRNIKKRAKASAKVHDNMPARDVVWVHDLNCGAERDNVRTQLEEKGIETRLFFKPLSTFPMFNGANNPNAMMWSRNGLYLPNFMRLSKRKRKIIGKIMSVL
jgi:dTDP-4-amino-4,6-dideoxygalactose transaminase